MKESLYNPQTASEIPQFGGPCSPDTLIPTKMGTPYNYL